MSQYASKAGMLGLSRTMAVEFARHGIRSNVVCPGYTATPLTRKHVGEQMYDYTTSDFASDDAAAITGSELTVDGGTVANLYVVETLPGG